MQFDLMRETAIRWSDPDPQHVPLLREGGITAVVAARNESFEKACLAAGIRVIFEEQVQTLGLHEVGKAKPGVIGAGQSGAVARRAQPRSIDCQRYSRRLD